MIWASKTQILYSPVWNHIRSSRRLLRAPSLWILLIQIKLRNKLQVIRATVISSRFHNRWDRYNRYHQTLCCRMSRYLRRRQITTLIRAIVIIIRSQMHQRRREISNFRWTIWRWMLLIIATKFPSNLNSFRTLSQSKWLKKIPLTKCIGAWTIKSNN